MDLPGSYNGFRMKFSDNSASALQSESIVTQDLISNFERIRLLLLKSKQLLPFQEHLEISGFVIAYHNYVAMKTIQSETKTARKRASELDERQKKNLGERVVDVVLDASFVHGELLGRYQATFAERLG